LIAINGKQVKAGDDYWQLLNNRLNRKVNVTFTTSRGGRRLDHAYRSNQRRRVQPAAL